MPTPLIITRTDFEGHVELAANMTDTKIKNRILEAEDFDLRELMGDAFYWSFVSNFNADGTPKDIASADTLKLYNGGSYVIKDNTYTFYGIKPVLVFYSASRLIKALDVHLTPNGVMQKRNDYSDHIESKDISWRANQYINQGLAYWNMCEKFLDNNKTLYPLWKPGCGLSDDKPRTAPKVSSIGADDCDGYSNHTIIRR